jgi:hypothetical protein
MGIDIDLALLRVVSSDLHKGFVERQVMPNRILEQKKKEVEL